MFTIDQSFICVKPLTQTKLIRTRSVTNMIQLATDNSRIKSLLECNRWSSRLGTIFVCIFDELFEVKGFYSSRLTFTKKTLSSRSIRRQRIWITASHLHIDNLRCIDIEPQAVPLGISVFRYRCVDFLIVLFTISARYLVVNSVNQHGRIRYCATSI